LLDDAIRGRLELRSPSFAQSLSAAWLSEVRMLVFGDVAYGRVQQPLPGQPDDAAVSSAGIGVRLDTQFGFDSQLDWAYPFGNNGEIHAGESRVHFLISQEF
jgi:hemolysin activation/secretion protein